MNRAIRQKNQLSKSRPASFVSQNKSPTKKQIQNAYWKSVKGFVSQELKNPSKMLESSVSLMDQQPPKICRYSVVQMQKMREQHGKEAWLKEKKKDTVKAQMKR